MTYTPEQDLNHNTPHPDHRYGCFDKGANDQPLVVQTGWTSDGRRVVGEVETEWLGIGCGHSYKVTDPCCSGCEWR